MSKNNGTNLEQVAIIQATLERRKNIAKWREAQRHEMDLPSGLHVTLRNVTMTDLMYSGKLPATLVDLFTEIDVDAKDVDLKQIISNMGDFQVMLDALVSIAMVEPLIGSVADDDHITLAELSSNDKMEIFNWANRDAPQLKPFRDGESEPPTPA